MAAGVYNIQAERSSLLLINITYKDDADAAVDLSGCTLALTVKDNASDTTPAFTRDLETDANNDLANGLFVIRITASEMDTNLVFDQGVYYIDKTDGSDTVRILEGKIQIADNSSY